MDSDRFKRTRRIILVRVLLAPFITIMLVCGTLVYYFASYSQAQVEAKLLDVTSEHRRQIDQFLRERVADLQLVCSTHRIEELRDQTRLADLFRNLQSTSEAFFDLGVFDEKGNHLAYVGPFELAGINYAQTEWFKAVQKRNLFVSDVFLGFRKKPHFIIAVRQEEAGHPWFLRATIDTLFFQNLVEDIRIGRTGEAYLVNREGILQTARASSGELMDPDPDYSYYVIDTSAVTSFSVRGTLNQQYLCAAGPLTLADWVLVVRQERGDAYALLFRAILVAVGIILTGGGVVAALAYVLATGQVNQLMQADQEQRRMKSQLIIAGKLAEVGEMSTGLAHEINNPLQVMKSEQTLIKDLMTELESGEPAGRLKTMEQMKDSVHQIGVQIERCSEITQELLKFARHNERAIQPVVIQEFLPQLLSTVERRARVANISLVHEIDPSLPPVLSDPGQIQQVLLNLVNNSIYALRDKDHGKVRVQAFLDDASNLTLSVSDDGCGIAPEDLEKIFLPFFTTKPPGQGTGLGLSTVYGIVHGLGGEITVRSELNGGTVFTVCLPLELAGNEVCQDKTHQQGRRMA